MAGDIVLYTLIPSGTERLPIPRGRIETAKLRLARSRDWLEWRLTRRFPFQIWRYEDYRNSNQGDIAVRQSITDQILRALGGAPNPVREVAWNHLNADEIERINSTAALVIVAGGGYLALDAGGDPTARCARDLEALTRVRVPLALGAVGINAPVGTIRPSAVALEALGRLGRQAIALSVRDVFGQQVLSGASGRDVALIGDPALFLTPARPRPRPRDGRPAVGLNFAFHGAGPAANLATNLPAYIKALRQLQARTGCRYSYFLHSDAEHLVHRLLAAAGVRAELVTGGPQQLVDAYAGMDLHIGEMMHSCILSLAAGTPALSIADDIKSHCLYQLMQLEDCLADVTRINAGTLVDQACALLAAGPPLRQRIARRKAALKPGQDAWWDRLLAQVTTE